MSRYEPSPAPLESKSLPEYVMRELRRVANVVAQLDASLSAAVSGGAPIGASYITVNAEASLSNERALSASTGLVVRDRSTSSVVVLELDVPALTSKSSSSTALYFLAFDASASAHVRVPGDAMPGSGGGSGEALKIAKTYLGTTVSIGAATFVTMSWAASLYDTGNFWSAGDAKHFTIPESGHYVFEAMIVHNAWTAGSGKGAWLVKNGLTSSQRGYGGAFTNPSTNSAATPFVSTFSASAGDKFHLLVYSTNASGIVGGVPESSINLASWVCLKKIGGYYSPLTQYGARLTITSPVTVANATNTTLSWASEIRDDGGLWSSADAGAIVIPIAGWYMIEAAVRWDVNATGGRNLWLEVDGVRKTATDTTPPSAAGTASRVVANMYLTAGQRVAVVARQSSGASRTLDTSLDACYFSAVKYP